MDPLTHGLLGAATGYVCLGRRLGWNAAAVGMTAGLLPDLDILIRSDSDPLLKIEYHRHFTHSFPFSPIGAAIAALFWVCREKHRANWKPIWLAALLAWWSHILCDSWTSYGTQFLVPFTNHRFSWDLMSIIDPIFTFTLLGGLVGARWATGRARPSGTLSPSGGEGWGEGDSPSARKSSNQQFEANFSEPHHNGCDYQPKCILVTLAFGAFLLGLGGVQKYRAHAAQVQLAGSRGHPIERWEVMPTLGNNVLWRSIYLSDGKIHRDRIRLGVFSPSTYATNDVLPIVSEQTLTPEERQRDVTHNSFVRFQWFADGWVARAPDDPAVIGDARYSLSSDRFDPIWGIRFTPPAARTEIAWVNRSRNRRIDLGEMWSEIIGSHPDYRPIKVP